jgi:hypothetical protein
MINNKSQNIIKKYNSNQNIKTCIVILILLFKN